MDKLVLAVYLIQVSRKPILRGGVDCYVDFLDEVPSDYQIKKDACASNHSLLIACQSDVGPRILLD
jgi:hypothetical protein